MDPLPNTFDDDSLEHRRKSTKTEHGANQARNYSYPKHVWSPAGGWYAQPANWRGNTLIAGAVIFGIVAVTWKFGADREKWAHKPQPGEWYPSRKYVHDLEDRKRGGTGVGEGQDLRCKGDTRRLT